MSPSAFIPFCEFGGDISLMSQKHDDFSFPICNSFQKTIYKDRVCYEVDLNKYISKNSSREAIQDMKYGLILFLDLNGDRKNVNVDSYEETKTINFGDTILGLTEEDEAQIMIGSLGI